MKIEIEKKNGAQNLRHKLKLKDQIKQMHWSIVSLQESERLRALL